MDSMVTLKEFGFWNGMEMWIKRGLGVSEEIEIWKMRKIRTNFQKCDRKKYLSLHFYNVNL